MLLGDKGISKVPRELFTSTKNHFFHFVYLLLTTPRPDSSPPLTGQTPLILMVQMTMICPEMELGAVPLVVENRKAYPMVGVKTRR